MSLPAPRFNADATALSGPAPSSLPSPLVGDPGPKTDLRDALVLTLPLLRARAMRLARDSRRAEDLVQDTLERALRFEASFAPGTNLKAWLQQVLYSVFVSRCRRQRRERRALEWLARDPCAWTRLEGVAALPSLTPRVELALDALPRVFAQAVRLVDLEERSYKDAAAELGIPVGTVMSRLFRGRRLLASALADAEQQGARRDPAVIACAA